MKLLIIYLIGLAVGYFCGKFTEWRKWKNSLYNEMRERLEAENDTADA